MKNKFLYYSLIGTFALLYFFVAFVSFLHAIEFFGLGNNKLLSILLAAAFEIGQATVLFALITTRNRHRFMAWSMMILLTSLQITANVFASFKFMDIAIVAGNIDWTYWQRSILFWLEVDTPELYKVTISWIIGALLPIIALGMIALVADNIKLFTEDGKEDEKEDEEYEYEYEENLEEDSKSKESIQNLEPTKSEPIELDPKSSAEFIKKT